MMPNFLHRDAHLKMPRSSGGDADPSVKVAAVFLAPLEHVQVSLLGRESTSVGVPFAPVGSGPTQGSDVALVDGGGAS